MTDACSKPVWRHGLWVVPLLILGWAGLLFYTDYQGDQRVAQEGRTVQGVIVAKSTASKGKGGGSYYLIEYRFQPQAGEPVTGVAKLDETAWTGLQEQQPIAVTYVPGDPAIHRAEGEAPAFSPIGATAVMLLGASLLLAGLYGCFVVKW